MKVSKEAVDDYKAAEYWKEFQNIVGIEETGTTLGDVNSDGKINIADLNLVIDIMSER